MHIAIKFSDDGGGDGMPNTNPTTSYDNENYSKRAIIDYNYKIRIIIYFIVTDCDWYLSVLYFMRTRRVVSVIFHLLRDVLISCSHICAVKLDFLGVKEVVGR